MTKPTGWAKALQAQILKERRPFAGPSITPTVVDYDRLVCIDFETYYDTNFSLSKMSTSGYVRDDEFKLQMMGIKVGLWPTQIVDGSQVESIVKSIDWATHTLLCHNVQFDGFILSHYFDVIPSHYFDSLSMARGLHSNDIGAGLDEVSKHYGGKGKIDGVLELTKGVRDWDQELFDVVAPYCVGDVDEMLYVFKCMLPKMPSTEMDIIDLTMRMFCDPVLLVDIPRVQAEYAREVQQREDALASVLNPGDYYDDKTVLKTKKERALVGKERDDLVIKRVVGSSPKFAELLRAEGVIPPEKVSPAWLKKPASEREDEEVYSYAFSKTDTEFLDIPEQISVWGSDYDVDNPDDMTEIIAKQARLRNLVDARLAIKSVGNATKAERFLCDGANGMKLPVGYSYYRAHTGRYGGNNKINMQNLTRGGELRQSILAPPGHVLIVADSGQIEARVNAWLWGEKDLLDSFRAADKYDAAQAKLPKDQQSFATGSDRDAYCKFGDTVYGREITKKDKLERFVGKVCFAEGSLVLTHRGLVPIQLITLEDRLWDGVEWVTHSGVIYQGIKEVITYDGLTATPDHEVFAQDGRVVSLGQAASEMVGLQRTGAAGQEVRFCDDHVIADTPRKRLSVRVGNTERASTQQTHHSKDSVERKTCSSSRFHESVQLQLDIPAHEERLDRRTNTRTVRVYDIANAGPRFRYTVSDVLVFNCVLGLGYQMGPLTFQLTLAKGALGGPPVHFDSAKCREIVNKYRATNKKIYNGWSTCGEVIKAMALPNTKDTLGPLDYEFETIWLPNGMALKYPGLSCDLNEQGMEEWSYQSKKSRTKIYSGKLCENIVQALARIIVCSHQMLEISKTMRVVMTTHDEIVTCVPEDQAESSFAKMIEIMQTPPPWCADIPLAAEGGYAYNYSK